MSCTNHKQSNTQEILIARGNGLGDLSIKSVMCQFEHKSRQGNK